MINISKISLSLLVMGTFSLASDIVTKKTINILQDNKSIGTIPILTPVKVLKKTKDSSIIRIRGFRLENFPQMVVRDMKRNELYVEFENELIANKNFKIIKKYEDDYGEIWHEVEGELTVKSEDLTKNIKDLNQKAKKTYEQNCSMCHHLPLENAYTVNQWPQQIDSMMEQVSLDKPTKSLIIKYLQQNAADSK